MKNYSKRNEVTSISPKATVQAQELMHFLPSPCALFDYNGHLISFSPACMPLFNTSNYIDCGLKLQLFFDISQTTIDQSDSKNSESQPDADFNEVGNSGATLVSFIPRDPITNLFSKTRFIEKINSALSQNTFTGASLLCISFENFDEFNTEFGENAGDRLLTNIAKRLTATLTDSYWVAKTGNANFCVFKASATTACDDGDFKSLPAQLKELLNRPFLINSNVAEMRTNVGWTTTQKPINSLELYRQAELSLSVNTETGGVNDKPYFPDMDQKRTEGRKLEFDLRKAILLKQFELHYQMQLNYTNRRVTGFEALIRWNHPEQGMVFPDVFIPLAEKTGLIVAIGEWVIKTACKEAMKWPEDITVAVNVSPIQLQSENLIGVIKTALQETGLSPKRLEIEITESSAIQDETESRQVLLALKELGLSIALDDFGTGYASLSYLRSFPFDKLKIDQSFVRCEENIHQNDLVLQSMFSLGKCFGMTTLAEGIETEEHQDKLLDLGCQSAQGYLYSRPIPFQKTFELLEKFNQIPLTAPCDSMDSNVVSARIVPTETNLFQIAYISDNAASVSSEHLNQVMDSIQQDSKRNNSADNISGALMFNQLCFAQILEGESQLIERTFERIQTDPRHQNIQVLDYGPIEKRSFPDWAMAFIGENDSNTKNFDQLALLSGSSASETSTANLQKILLELVEQNNASQKAA